MASAILIMDGFVGLVIVSLLAQNGNILSDIRAFNLVVKVLILFFIYIVLNFLDVIKYRCIYRVDCGSQPKDCFNIYLLITSILESFR